MPKSKDIQPFQVNGLLSFVAQMEKDPTHRLAILTAALVISCRSMGVKRGQLLGHIKRMYGIPVEVVPKDNDNAKQKQA